MKPIISIKFHKDSSINDVMNLVSHLMHSHRDKFRKFEMVPVEDDLFKIVIDDTLVHSEKISGSVHYLTQVDTRIKEYLGEETSPGREGSDCFGWGCSDHLRNTTDSK